MKSGIEVVVVFVLWVLVNVLLNLFDRRVLGISLDVSSGEILYQIVGFSVWFGMYTGDKRLDIRERNQTTELVAFTVAVMAAMYASWYVVTVVERYLLQIPVNYGSSEAAAILHQILYCISGMCLPIVAKMVSYLRSRAPG